jgi:ABC-2 type transport system ATP-binding protein
VDVELRQGLWAFIRRLNREGHTIVLTTHYLEEAQQLCARIGMLRGGRLIALDSTRALLARLADVQVTLRLRGDLPAALRARAVEQGDGRWRLRVDAAAEVEAVLAACREAGAAIDEVEVGHADLEDVFVQLMGADRERIEA